jgi:[protein-PII] uridylyltransferase
LLLVGAWLHDIGKGYPGDHTDTGMIVVEKIAARMGFDDDDVARLVAMVRHHLLLPDVATRRDLADPTTAAAVAEAIGDRDLLELLAALTEADSLATGPSAWSDWKATLVRELVDRTARLLAGHAPEEPPPLEHPPLPAGAQLAVVGDGATCTVVAPDRAGLFCKVAGVLALHKLDVVAAQAGSATDGYAVEQFTVEPAFGGEPDWPAVAADVERALAGRLAVDARLSARARSYGGRAPTAASSAAPRVVADNEASMTATVLEVRASDGVGVLYRITRAMAECELDIRAARISTVGHEVVDAFYVVDGLGGKITDAEHLAEIERAVLAELART